MTEIEPATTPGVLKQAERLDALIRLYTQELDRQKQVESIQWRINFSVWTFIALAAPALKQASIDNHFWLSLGGAVLAFLHFVAIVKNIRSIRATATMWKCYRESANRFLYEPTALPTLKDDVSEWFHDPRWWVAAIFGTTLLLIAVALAWLW